MMFTVCNVPKFLEEQMNKMKDTITSDMNEDTAVVSIANKFKDCDIDGSIGRCIIDLKSILGVLSFGLPKVIDITVRSDDKALVKEFEDSIMFWRCNDDG